MITVKQISSRRGKKKFFKFLIDLYKDNPYACPNLYMDEFGEFNPKINDAFRFADCKMFLAYKDGKLAGRIAGIWHRGANEKFGLKQLRFTRFDVIDDFEVTKALFDELFKWAEELGMEEIIGPISFSDLNEEGMLIEGFDKPSTYIEIYNHPYYVEHMEKLGAYKVVDWNCFRLTMPDKVDEKLQRLSDKIAAKNGYTILDVRYYLKHDKKKLSEYIMQCLDILDEAYSPLYGTSPLSEKQKRREMKVIYQALIPEFAALIMKDDKVIAYGFLIPSMNKVLQKGRGHVIPRALKEYINAFKNVEVADMMSIGITKEHNNKGAVAMIVTHCLKGLIQHNVKFVEGGPQLENNRHIQNLWKNYEHELVKRRRCWGLKVPPKEN
ncbi:MAG: N-acetyltransferase [Clostridia bacterium]|nr:N-acetyltransferase [Clostridia bacterium]